MNKTVVLTGGSTGIGAATVERLVKQNVEVIMLDIKPFSGEGVRFIQCDMGDRAAIDAALTEIPTPIDALVNFAGIPGPEPGELVLRVNFLGLRHLTERLPPAIRDGGSIVNISSLAGQGWKQRMEPVTAMLDTADFDAGVEWCRADEKIYNRDPYTFSKQCVAAYTMRAAGFALDRRVRFNCISPGWTETQLTPKFRELTGDEHVDWMLEQVDALKPEDIAEVIAFVAIGECGCLNGADIPVDGGFRAGLLSGWINFEESPWGKARAAKAAAAKKS